MRPDARKLHQAIQKRWSTAPLGESEGAKRVRIIATPLEAPTKENTLIVVRMTSDDNDVPLVNLQPRASSSVRQPPEQSPVPPPVGASSSQVSRQDKGKAPQVDTGSRRDRQVEEEQEQFIDFNVYFDDLGLENPKLARRL